MISSRNHQRYSFLSPRSRPQSLAKGAEKPKRRGHLVDTAPKARPEELVNKHAQQLFTEAAELFLPLVAQSSDRNRARVKEICEGCLESAASEKAKAADEEQDVGVPPQPPEIPEQLPPNPQAINEPGHWDAMI